MESAKTMHGCNEAEQAFRRAWLGSMNRSIRGKKNNLPRYGRGEDEEVGSRHLLKQSMEGRLSRVKSQGSLMTLKLSGWVITGKEWSFADWKKGNDKAEHD